MATAISEASSCSADDFWSDEFEDVDEVDEDESQESDEPASKLTAGRRAYRDWLQFHAANPHVYDLFKAFAREAKAAQPYFGARMIVERIRWYCRVETTGNDFKINNNYAPLYARLLMLENPTEYFRFFRSRPSRSEVSDWDILRDLLIEETAKGS